jgi:hypothetical protein
MEEIVWGGRMYDVLKTAPDGSQSIDYTHFDDVEMLTPVQ